MKLFLFVKTGPFLLLFAGCSGFQTLPREAAIDTAEIYDISKVGEEGFRLRQPVVTDFLRYVRSTRPTYGAIFVMPSETDPEPFFRTGNVIEGKPRIEVGTRHLSKVVLPGRDVVTNRPAIVVQFTVRTQGETSAVVEAVFRTTEELVPKEYLLKKSQGTWTIEKVTFGPIS